MTKVSIFGSCVSRDIFRIVKGKYELNYHARTSLVSAVSEPLAVNESDIILSSAFQRKMVIQDFNKNFFESTLSFNPDIVIIDFIDERFDLLKYAKSYVTKTNEFVSGKMDRMYTFKEIKRFEKSTHRLWKRSCKRFIANLLRVVPKEKIFLHEAFWAEDYIENGVVKFFDNTEMIQNNNEILKAYYAYFKKHCPVTVVKYDRLGDVNHVWGKSPMHYTEEYYRNIYKQLRA